MTVGDGGHIWPFRDQDPRYKDLVATKDKDLQTDTKEALIAYLGLPGGHYSLDDLWARLKVDSGVPDTSEPFEEDFLGPSSDWAPPDDLTDSGIHYTEVQLEGAGGICNNHTIHRIDDLWVSADGLSVIVCNASDDICYSYTLGTAWDYDSVVANTGTDGQVNGSGIEWAGVNWAVRVSTNGGNVRIMTGSGLHAISGSNTQASVFNFPDNGFFTGSTGQFSFNSDGSRLYVTGAESTTEFIKTFTITDYNLDTISESPAAEDTVTELNISATIGNPGATNFQVSPDETKIYFFTGTFFHLLTMSTPGDVSTGTWTLGTININSTMFGTSGLDSFHIHADAQQIAFADGTSFAPEIFVADMNFVAP